MLCMGQAVANGDVNAALSAATIFADTFAAANDNGTECGLANPSAQARERILATMLRMDAVTYGSSTYILQVRMF